jgi:HEAT repeat protein
MPRSKKAIPPASLTKLPQELIIETPVEDPASQAAQENIQSLIRQLPHDENFRHTAADALVDLGEAAVPQLVEALHNEQLCGFAIHVLRRIGPNAAAAVPALIDSLHHPDPHIATSASRALRSIGSAARSALMNALKDGVSLTRREAAFPLSEICPDDPTVTTALIQALNDPDKDVREAAIKVLAERDDQAAVVPISQLLLDHDVKFLQIVVDALVSMCGERFVIETLKQLRPDLAVPHEGTPTPEQTTESTEPESILPNLELHQRIDMLISLLSFQTAVNELAAIGEPAVPALVKLLNDDYPARRRHAAIVLWRMAQTDPKTAAAALPTLIEKLRNDSEPKVRGRAAQVLISVVPADPKVLTPLIAALRNDSSALVRANIILFLGFDKVEAAVPALIDALNDPEERVRKSAETSLELVKGKIFLDNELEKLQKEIRIRPKARPEPGPLPPTEQKIQELIAALPDDPRERLKAIVALFTTIRNQAAEAMQPAIALLLKEAQQLDFEGMSYVSRLINRALNDTHRALLNPETNLPALVESNRPRPSSEVSYLQLLDTRHAGDGRRHRVRIQDGPDRPNSRRPVANPLPRIASDQIKLVSTNQEPEHIAVAEPSAGRGR